MSGFATSMRFLCLLFLSSLILASNAQLDPSRSFFLLNGASHGNLTLVSLSAKSNNLLLPPTTASIPIQSLTDIVNSRFVILSGEDSGAQGVNFTFSSISYTQVKLTTINSFMVPKNLQLRDVTYDLSAQKPVSLLTNSTGCFFMSGYGPVGNNPLPLTQILPCNGVTTIGAMIQAERIVTVATHVQNNQTSTEFCFGNPSLPLSCQTSAGVTVSNLIGAGGIVTAFPTVLSQNNITTAGIYLGLSGQIRALGQLLPGNLADNEHMPTYWDPLHLVFSGAWKMKQQQQVQIFASTYPATQWFSPAPFNIPQGDLIGLALAYKPVRPPTPPPPQPAKHNPSSKTGVIVGSVIGGIAAFSLFVGVAIFIRRSFSFQYRRLPDM